MTAEGMEAVEEIRKRLQAELDELDEITAAFD